MYCDVKTSYYVRTSYSKQVYTTNCTQTTNMSDSNSELSIILDLLKDINQKLDNVIPRVVKIESRLDKLDCIDSLSSDIKSSTSDILAEVRDCSQSVMSFTDSIREGSKAIDLISQGSDQTDQEFLSGDSAGDHDVIPTRYGLVMSDSDSTELATRAGHLINCKVDVFNYKQEDLKLELFDKKMEFVIIQDSGQLLDQYNELTNTTVKEITSHVQQLVKLATSILTLQPGTKVLFGSLPPRYDGRLRSDLVRVYNGLLLTESFMEERISVVSQSQLTCRFEQKKVERYEADLVTLTRYGKKLRDKNIALQIAEVVPHLRVIKKTQDTNHQYKRGYALHGGKIKVRRYSK